MCNICGQPICSNPQYCQSRLPFCDQCVEDTHCVSPIDTQCIIYHFNTSTPTRLINLNFPNGTNLEVILEKIDALIGGINLPFSPQDTLTVKWTPGGISGHSPKADVRISSQPNNHLSAKTNGLFVEPFNAEYLVKTDINDTPDFLQSQIIGGTDGVVTNDVGNVNGLLQIIPRVDILAMFQRIRDNFAEDFCEIVNSCTTNPPPPSGCTGVSYASSADLPPGIVGEPYSYLLPLLGTPPFTITGITKPTWMTIVAGPNNILFGGTPDVEEADTPVEFTINNCSGNTVVFTDTVTTTSTSPNPSPLVGTFKLTCFGDNCSQIGDAGFSFIFAQPLITPLTIKIAARQYYANVGQYYKLGYNIIPGAVPGNNYEPQPVTITIPAGTTTYNTPSYVTFGAFAGNFGCYPSCNSNYGNAKTTDIWIEVQAPDTSLVLTLTNTTGDQYNPLPAITYTQV